METLVVIWIGIAALTAIAAKSRNREPFLWLIIGIVFGIFALAAVLIMKPEPDEAAKKLDGRPTPQTHFLCPDCNKLIKKDTDQCPKCGCRIIPEVKPAASIQDSSNQTTSGSSGNRVGGLGG